MADEKNKAFENVENVENHEVSDQQLDSTTGGAIGWYPSPSNPHGIKRLSQDDAK